MPFRSSHSWMSRKKRAALIEEPSHSGSAVGEVAQWSVMLSVERESMVFDLRGRRVVSGTDRGCVGP